MNDTILRVREALQSGELTADDLTARRLGAWLGKTTSVLYHHWGSLDGFLYEVAQAGFAALGERVAALPLTEAASEYVSFAIEQPALYDLMFHRTYDWAFLRARADLRAATGFLLWQGLVAKVAAAGSRQPEADARVLYGGMHGIASLAISGRANIGDLTVSDADAARAAARRLVHLVLPGETP